MSARASVMDWRVVVGFGVAAALWGCSGSDAPGTSNSADAQDMRGADSGVSDLGADQSVAERDMSEQADQRPDADQGSTQTDMAMEPDQMVVADMMDMEGVVDACGGCDPGYYCDDSGLGGSLECIPNPCERDGDVTCDFHKSAYLVTCDGAGDDIAPVPVQVSLCDEGEVCDRGSCSPPCEGPAASRRCSPDDSSVRQICAVREQHGALVWIDEETCEADEVCVPSTGRCAAHQCSEEELARGFVCTDDIRARRCELVEGRRMLTANRVCASQTQRCDTDAADFESACQCLPERHTCVLGQAICGTGSSNNRYRLCREDMFGCRVWGSLEACSDVMANMVLGCEATATMGVYRPLRCGTNGTCGTTQGVCNPATYAP